MKKIISLVSGITLALGIGVMSASAEGQVPGLVYNNEVKQIENIQNVNGRVMLPFRAVFEMMGATVDYEDGTRKVTATRGGKVVEFFADGTSIKVTEAGSVKEIPAEIGFDYERNRVMVPVRFVSNAMGARVGWDDSIKTVYVLDTYPLLQSLTTVSPAFTRYLDLSSQLADNASDSSRLTFSYTTPATDSAPAVAVNFNMSMLENKFNNTGDSEINLSFNHENLDKVLNYNIGQLDTSTINIIKTDSAIYLKTDIISKLTTLLPDASMLHMAQTFLGSGTWFRLDYDFVVEKAGKPVADALFGKSPKSMDSLVSTLEAAYAMNRKDVTAADVVLVMNEINMISQILSKVQLTETDANNFTLSLNTSSTDIIPAASAPVAFNINLSSTVKDGFEISDYLAIDYTQNGATLKLNASETSVKLNSAPAVNIPANSLSVASIMTLLGM